ncbi:hypothetical protein RUM44_009823 [Polyplax serrata]|uniref:Uncharacterized protein n=1 Tax=Polyplax serrata TaxID=468196 RepID=A0ABR1ATT9_POLSC
MATPTSNVFDKALQDKNHSHQCLTCETNFLTTTTLCRQRDRKPCIKFLGVFSVGHSVKSRQLPTREDRINSSGGLVPPVRLGDFLRFLALAGA